MPSGAKKRKAAKKKKEQAAQQINTTTNHGNEDQRSQDERESDDGIASPTSHDNNENHHNFFAEGDGQSRNNDPSHHQPLVADEGSAKEVSGNMNTTQKEELAEKYTIKIEKVLKPVENIEITDSSLEHEKSSGRSSSCSRSSSDDEAQEIEKRPEKEKDAFAVEVIEHSDVDKPPNSLPKQAVPMSANSPFSGPSANVILETAAVMDSAKPVEPKSEEQIHVESISEETSEVSAVDTVVSNEGDVKSLPNLIENTAKEFPASDEIARASSGANDFEVKENESKILPSSYPVPDTKYVHEGVKESEIPVSSEKEAPAQATHPVVQRTSWLSCCGLFDVITSSSR